MAAIAASAFPSRTFLAVAAGVLAAAAAGIARAQVVDIESATGRPGDTVELTVSFVGQGSGASALKVDMGFDPETPIAARGGKPACSVNPDLMKESTSFVFLPVGCTHGIDCAEVRAAVISLTPENNPVPVPSGVIFSCTMVIPFDASVGDRFEIAVDSAAAVFPDGREIDVTAASEGGSVRVVEAVPCAGDSDGSGDVTLGEVQKAFAAYLNGCPPNR